MQYQHFLLLADTLLSQFQTLALLLLTANHYLLMIQVSFKQKVHDASSNLVTRDLKVDNLKVKTLSQLQVIYYAKTQILFASTQY